MAGVLQNHILHLDMDAFFASVEQLDHPEWRGKPVIVGAPPDQRGVVSTCSYEARRFGVHSAMPSRTAFQLCPQGIFVPGRYARYEEISQRIRSFFYAVTPFVEMASIDEAFLDLKGVHSITDPVAAARQLKARIRTELGLSSSVGVASNMFLAKLASDLQKPDGLTVVPQDPEEIKKFLAPLPVRKIWGVGQKTGQVLESYGLKRIADIQKTPLVVLCKLLGSAGGLHLYALSRGQDSRQVQREFVQEKSISREETFREDCTDMEMVRHCLLGLCEEVGSRLRAAGLLAGCAQLKLRFQDFRTISRQMPVRPASQADRILLKCATSLFEQAAPKEAIRLVGFGVTQLQEPGVTQGEEPRQLLLFPEPENEQPAVSGRDASLDQAVDQLRQKFGSDVLKRGFDEKK
ncbi:MAG: DNA polymerase IV [Lentisphaeria bacterium]|nr:DNA polymerase IV [Lentisphaeria bacterium]